MKIIAILLIILVLFSLSLILTVHAAPDYFTVARESGSRTPYLWFDDAGHYRGEIRYRACIDSTLLVEVRVRRAGQFQLHSFLINPNRPADESEWAPSLSLAPNSVCLLRIAHAPPWNNKRLVEREVYLPTLPR